MQDYAPGLATLLFQNSYNANYLFGQLARRSDEIDPSDPDHLSARHLVRAYEEVVEEIQQAPSGEEERWISEALLNKLDRSFREDKDDRRFRDCSKKSQRHFRAYADVSANAQSESLGSLLSTWFSNNSRYITEHDDTQSLAQWCYAITKACMTDGERHACLRTVLTRRPEIIDELQRFPPSSKLQVLLRALQQSLQHIRNPGLGYGNNSLLPYKNNRGFRSSDRRRSTSRNRGYGSRRRSPSFSGRRWAGSRSEERLERRARNDLEDAVDRVISLNMRPGYAKRRDRHLRRGYDSGSSSDSDY